MLQLSVEDVSMKFDELHQLKLNDWKIIESPERKVTHPGLAPSLRAVPRGLPGVQPGRTRGAPLCVVVSGQRHAIRCAGVCAQSQR